MVEFDYDLEHKLGKSNLIVVALSRKGKLAIITHSQWETLDLIYEGMEHDLLAKNLVNMTKEGKTKKFCVEVGLCFKVEKPMKEPYQEMLGFLMGLNIQANDAHELHWKPYTIGLS